MKKVSVIIPTYKRSDKLIRAINSILMQTYKNIEIIVVDDNDRDSLEREENEKKLEKYVRLNQIVYLKHDHNKNGAAARNTGIRNSSGDYITFLDDDDYFLENRIEKMVNVLESNPEYMGAYSSVAFFRNKKMISVNLANKSGFFTLDLLKQKNIFGTGSNIFLKKEIVDKIGLFDEKFIRHQDMEYMVRFFEYGKMISVRDILVVKCVDDCSNVPSYEKMLYIKKMYLEKFKTIIDSYENQLINQIYYSNYLELLYLFPEKYEEIHNELIKFGKFTFADKMKFRLKQIKNRIRIINKIILLIKSLKNKKYKIRYIDE